MDIPDDVDALTVAWRDDQGAEKIRQLGKKVLSVGGGWATIAFSFTEIGPDGSASEMKVNLRRYRKRGGAWQVHAKFVLTGTPQMTALAEVLGQWSSDG